MSDCVRMQQQDKHSAAAMSPTFTRTPGFPPLPAPPSSSSSTIQHHPSDCNSGALRRTMSADMSSDRWKAHSGIKKTPSVENLQALDDVWSSILNGKANDADKAALPPPYVHPLVKRSASTLSEKSLLVCTESLGSETGSDGFSSEPCDSEQEDKVDEEEQNAQPEAEVVVEKDHVKAVEEEPRVAAASSGHLKKVAQRSLPPPLPSLAHRGDGSNLHMRSHRSDGRLVLEAVSVPSLNCFRAERQDGRLLLTFSDTDEIESDKEADVTEDEQEELESDLDSENECEAEEGEMGPIFDKSKLFTSNYAPKFLCLARENTSPWPHRLNKVVVTLDDSNNHSIANLIHESKYSKDLAAETLNQYEYSWRVPAEIVAVMSPEERGMNMEVRRRGKKSAEAAEREEVRMVEDKRAAQVEYQVPNSLRGCNQRRRMRSPLQLEPRCIAT